MILLLIFTLVVLLFGFVVVFGAPYLPTLKHQSGTALDLLNLQPGQTLLELGCGDGRVAKYAARRGIRVVGYELNPILVIYARLNTWRYKRLVSIKWGNFWQKKWPPADGVFVFLLDKYMQKLDKKIIQEYKGRHVKLASYTFKVPGRKPIKTRDGVFLYQYP